MKARDAASVVAAMDEAVIIMDHVRGSRRGQRQQFAATTRVRLGRHPDGEVIFHASRDLDASSRHAELLVEGQRHVLRDVGSSNGTLLDGRPSTEIIIPPGEPLEVEFGAGGPVVRIYVGPPERAPAPLHHPSWLRRPLALWLLAAALVIGGVVAALVAWVSLV